MVDLNHFEGLATLFSDLVSENPVYTGGSFIPPLYWLPALPEARSEPEGFWAKWVRQILLSNNIWWCP